jgi:hypothetical protein
MSGIAIAQQLAQEAAVIGVVTMFPYVLKKIFQAWGGNRD